MECNDIPSDISTESELVLNGPNTSVWDSCNNDLDNDWHSVQLDYGKTYSFTLIPQSEPNGLILPELSLFDRSGFDLNDRQYRNPDSFRLSNLAFRFTARGSGTYYVDAFQGSLLSDTNYEIEAREINNDNNPDAIPLFLTSGFATYDELELVDDIDTFQIDVEAGTTYYFRTYGAHEGVGTLVDPSMQLRRGEQILANSNDSVGLDPDFIFTASTRETLTVQVSGAGVGTYAVQAMQVDDAAGNSTTTSRMHFNGTDIATTTGYIGHFADIDWHKVNLSFGDIVKVSMRGEGLDYLETPSLLFRDPQQQFIFGDGFGQPSDDNQVDFYYRAQRSGTHYVIARTKRDLHNGEYRLTVEKMRYPVEPVPMFGHGDSTRLFMTDDTVIPLGDLLELNGIAPYSFQVNSTIPIYRDGVEFAANQTWGILADEIDLWTLQADADQIPSDASLLIRANSGTSSSEWVKFDIASEEPDTSLIAPRTWDPNQAEPVTFSFVFAQPDYYDEGEVGDFQAIANDSAVGSFIREVFAEFNRAIPEYQFVETDLGTSGDINIFAGTDFGSPFLGYWPGTQKGGDLILDTPTFGASPTLNDQQKHQLLQGIGSVLGLNFKSGIAWNDSVMGDVPAPNSLTPENFSRFDWLALRSLYAEPKATSDPGQSAVVLHNTNDFITISSAVNYIIVGDDVADNSYTIDLRDRGRTFAREGNIPSSEVYVAVGAQVLSGVGGNGNDLLYGNSLDNVLDGEDGDDIAIGGVGNDIFNGGLGNDIFIHYFGDGTDYISDTGGIDTLCFFGRDDDFNVSQLSEDYLFTRNGNVLEVSLTLNGGEQEGLVRIDSGFSQNNLVESLELWHNDTMQERISLFDVWNKLAPGQSARFELTENSDTFGSLVSQLPG